MYQPTPAKFIPLPNSEMNIAKKKYRNPRCAQMSDQSVFGGAVAVTVEDMGRTNHISGSRTRVVNVLATLKRMRQVKLVDYGKRSAMHRKKCRQESGRQSSAGNKRAHFSQRDPAAEDSFCSNKISQSCGWGTAHSVTGWLCGFRAWSRRGKMGPQDSQSQIAHGKVGHQARG